MADFRKYSEKYPFRQRSETPEIAVELSLQPWRRFGVDGVIMFSGRIDYIYSTTKTFDVIIISYSDILTPLPAMGVDFTIIEGKGPKIIAPLKSQEDIDNLKILKDVATEVPFLGPILKASKRLNTHLKNFSIFQLGIECANIWQNQLARLHRRSVDSGGLFGGRGPLETLQEDEDHVFRTPCHGSQRLGEVHRVSVHICILPGEHPLPSLCITECIA